MRPWRGRDAAALIWRPAPELASGPSLSDFVPEPIDLMENEQGKLYRDGHWKPYHAL